MLQQKKIKIWSTCDADEHTNVIKHFIWGDALTFRVDQCGREKCNRGEDDCAIEWPKKLSLRVQPKLVCCTLGSCFVHRLSLTFLVAERFTVRKLIQTKDDGCSQIPNETTKKVVLLRRFVNSRLSEPK